MVTWKPRVQQKNETLLLVPVERLESKGKAHFVLLEATVRRDSSITFSDQYIKDTAVLSLSSFNPTAANFFDLESHNGACRYIGNFKDTHLLQAIQENTGKCLEKTPYRK